MATDASGLRNRVRQYGSRLAATAAADLLRDVDRDVPVDTGQLRGTGDVRRVGPTRWRIWFPARYASFTDTGNADAGRSIVPTRAKVLRFRVGGQTVFAQKVRLSSPGWFTDKVTPDGWLRALRSAQRKVRG